MSPDREAPDDGTPPSAEQSAHTRLVAELLNEAAQRESEENAPPRFKVAGYPVYDGGKAMSSEWDPFTRRG